MRTGNPTLTENAFEKERTSGLSGEMTIQGTVNKTLFVLLLVFLSACWAWSNPLKIIPLFWPLTIGGFVIAMVTVFKKPWAAVTTPLYALIEGLFLGAISLVFEKKYPGIVTHAVALTFGTLFCLLLAYKSRLIRVTESFRLGIAAATGGIALVYIINMVLTFFGHSIPFIYKGGLFGIVFSLFVVGVAAFNLVLDFDFIENNSGRGIPKYMEWYGAFSLLVTLVWLYLEILRLLSKISSRD